MEYLPDDPKTQTDRQFLVDIINTFDPDFFKGAIAEINRHIMSRAAATDKTVTLSGGMFRLLQSIDEKATIM